MYGGVHRTADFCHTMMKTFALAIAIPADVWYIIGWYVCPCGIIASLCRFYRARHINNEKR